MDVRTRPWRAAEQARLLSGLRSGYPPVALCRELGRAEDDLRAHICLLLGDPPSPESPTAVADLDLLWLRVRTTSVRPAPPSPAAIAELWESATGIGLTPTQRTEFARDPAVPRLGGVGRHALLVTAPEVVEKTGLLDLDDWLEAARAVDLSRRLPAPDPADPSRTMRLRSLLAATIEDIAPAGARAAMSAHLGLSRAALTPPNETGTEHRPEETDLPSRRTAVVEVARAAGVEGRPATFLRDALLTDAAVEALSRALPGAGFAGTATLALFGGRHEPAALRLAGRLTSPWHTPPNLGRGVVVRLPSR